MKHKELFETYISEHINSVYRFAYSYMKNKEDAEDVVNESVLKALKAINTLRKPDHVGTWFYRIVANTALTAIKKNKKMIYMDTVEVDVEDESLSDISFEQMIVILEPKYKNIVVLRFFEGMPLEEISMILGENLNTVKTRLYKALKMLRIEMEGSL